jgi:hypothetical protein
MDSKQNPPLKNSPMSPGKFRIFWMMAAWRTPTSRQFAITFAEGTIFLVRHGSMSLEGF